MAQEWGITVDGAQSKLHDDVPAALSIAKRRGAGKMRHINVKS